MCQFWLVSLFLKGHEQDALKLMSTYLPKDGSGGSAYQEGGGLFALGRCTYQFLDQNTYMCTCIFYIILNVAIQLKK